MNFKQSLPNDNNDVQSVVPCNLLLCLFVFANFQKSALNFSVYLCPNLKQQNNWSFYWINSITFSKWPSWRQWDNNKSKKAAPLSATRDDDKPGTGGSRLIRIAVDNLNFEFPVHLKSDGNHTPISHVLICMLGLKCQSWFLSVVPLVLLFQMEHVFLSLMC